MASTSSATAAPAAATSGARNPSAVFPAHDASASFSFPKAEETVLEFWKDIDAFQESLRQSEGKPLYTFYDGPPFATGLPHHGHILMGTVKDIVTRFAHSSGFHVERRFGWDTHGLPVEHEIDKKLNIKSKADVMAMGIDKYNAECRAIVMRYSGEWRRTVERLGRWIDFDNDYKTLNPSFMESVWWVFGQLWKKDLVYRGVRVMPYTTGLTTPLSNFEAQQAYKDVQDPAVTVAFQLVDDPSVALLAWTTTPWTLPSNLGICVHPDLTYIKIHDKERDRLFIICDQLLTTLYKDPAKAKKAGKYTIEATYKGKEMAGWKYTPLFDYFYEKYKDRAFKVLVDTYVTATSGTGIVHQAPAFGEEDHRIAIREGIVDKAEMPPCPIDDRGLYTDEVPDFKGIYVKDADKPIMKRLKDEGKLIVQSQIEHSYPHCWRSGTPLLYRVIPVWFVKVQGFNDQLVQHNGATQWVPQSVGDTRFKSWLENARDWNISRNRYWGTPLPLWASEDYEEIVCVSSVEELDQLAGCGIVKDLHRETIDHITIPSKKGKGVLRRVEEVFDCWFESGSMPYAQVHYPFENKEKFEQSFPANFIAEAIDQTRGWFYTLLVLSSHLFGTAPWKNLIVCGHVLAADGKKMSKSLRNFPDPGLIVDKYGADALRLFLVNSPVVRGDSLRFREEGVKEVVSRVMLPFLNSYRFFLGQAALIKNDHGIDFKYDPHAKLSGNVMDRWILARCQSLIKHVKAEMEAYKLYTVAPKMLILLDELTNWYIRFNRLRLKGEGGVDDTVAALQTLFETLLTLCRALSSFIPFITETIYQGLRVYFPTDVSTLNAGADVRSLHFLPFPNVREEYFDPLIERQVERMQAVIDLGRMVRTKKNLVVKTPLKELVVYHPTAEYLSDVETLLPYIEKELNVQTVTLTSDEVLCGIKYRATADFTVLGKKLRGALKAVKDALPNLTSAEVQEFIEKGVIKVGGVELTKGDLTIVRYVELPARSSEDDSTGKADYEAQTNSDVVILLDTLSRPELERQGLSRELVNRIQRLRKSAGLVQTDEVDVYYHFEGDGNGEDLGKIVEEHEEGIKKVLKGVPKSRTEMGANQVEVKDGKDEVEVGDHKFTLTLCWPEGKEPKQQ